ncbi:MAG: hypothetical protein EA348_04740 [Pseudomonadaceae bacterium]|nr:MAG: hypothetical protein EA348_04740 [Pseudomonadaceae bacterium]
MFSSHGRIFNIDLVLLDSVAQALFCPANKGNGAILVDQLTVCAMPLAMSNDCPHDLDAFFTGEKVQQLVTQAQELFAQTFQRRKGLGTLANQGAVLTFQYRFEQAIGIIEMSIQGAFGHPGTARHRLHTKL